MPTINRKSITFVPKAKPFEGVKQNNYSLYNSQEWRRFRAVILEYEPLCRMCSEQGDIKEAKYVDHIIPINEGGAVWESSNLQPLCSAHHASKSAKDGHKHKAI